MKIQSKQEMLDFGKSFAGKIKQNNPKSATVIELVGDVGTGKTTFTRGLAQGLGITDEITSPSFTISKTYALPYNGHLIHYDFYRLSDPGIMLSDLEDNLADPSNIIIIEWGESISDILPKSHTTINIEYDADNHRIVTVK